MANKPKLNPQIVKFLHERLQRPESTIRKDISILKRNFPQATSNAIAQIYAQQHGESVRRLLTKEDKLTVPPVEIEKSPSLKTMKSHKQREQIKTIIQLHTADHFLKRHVDEINRAYSKGCYTCVFVLTRKVLENLIIGILKGKFPNEPGLFFDLSKSRNQDFSLVLDNLFKKRNDFDADKKKAIERLNQKLKPFKNDANDKVHSLFHIVESPTEVDDWNLDTIVALIVTIM